MRPMAKPETAAGQGLGSGDGLARNGETSRSTPLQRSTTEIAANNACSGTRWPVSAPMTAPTTDAGAIHRTTRQETRPSRACR